MRVKGKGLFRSLTADGTYEVSTTIQGSSVATQYTLPDAWLEVRINPAHFVRLHRNNIVSIKQIKAISGTNDSQVELLNGMKLPLSRNHRNLVLQILAPRP